MLAENIAQYARQKGIGSLPKGLQKWAADQLAPPTIHWTQEIATMTAREVSIVKGRKRQTYLEVNRRAHGSDWIIPGRRASIPDLVVGIDTSGSMLDGSLNRAMSEVNGVLRARGVKKIRYLTIEAMTGEVKKSRGRKLDELGSSGGGTDMRIGYRLVGELIPRPTNFILFTDGETPWPKEKDNIPGVRCMAAIITASKSRYEQIVENVPSWIKTVYVPLSELNKAA
jgi:predicted metal-dependent peptidase